MGYPPRYQWETQKERTKKPQKGDNAEKRGQVRATAATFWPPNWAAWPGRSAALRVFLGCGTVQILKSTHVIGVREKIKQRKSLFRDDIYWILLQKVECLSSSCRYESLRQQKIEGGGALVSAVAAGFGIFEPLILLRPVGKPANYAHSHARLHLRLCGGSW